MQFKTFEKSIGWPLRAYALTGWYRPRLRPTRHPLKKGYLVESCSIKDEDTRREGRRGEK